MIINSNNPLQRNILTYKCYYMTMAQIMHVLEKKGYQNPAEEAVKVVTAYHDLVAKNGKNHYNKDYNEAFALIDNAIKKIANQIFYNLEAKSFDAAYEAFRDFDYINVVLGLRTPKKKSI
ncbi:MAG: hypothetical protein IJ830_03065 [Alphaproteobacteria bacterium]|nr:hypothetical protein [Alphaproteobacteria bacterium]